MVRLFKWTSHLQEPFGLDLCALSPTNWVAKMSDYLKGLDGSVVWAVSSKPVQFWHCYFNCIIEIRLKDFIPERSRFSFCRFWRLFFCDNKLLNCRVIWLFPCGKLRLFHGYKPFHGPKFGYFLLLIIYEAISCSLSISVSSAHWTQSMYIIFSFVVPCKICLGLLKLVWSTFGFLCKWWDFYGEF